jgi:HEAT repeat protein
VEDLAPLVASTDLELAVAAAHALGSATGEAAEAALVGALQSDADGVRLAAVESLGRMGSALAVAPLHTCNEEHRFDPPLRSAVRQAVATIQSRISGASPGQLSMAVDEVGQVSLADTDARGQVSLAATSEAPAAERLAAATAGPIPDQAGESQQDDRRQTLEQARRSQLASGQSSRR